MFDRLTAQARSAIALSQEAAREAGHPRTDSSDLVLGLLSATEGLAATALADVGVTATIVRARRPKREGPERGGYIPLSQDYKRVLECSLREAIASGHSNLTTGHLLLGILALPDGSGAQSLLQLNVTDAAIREAVERQHAQPAGDEAPSSLVHGLTTMDGELPVVRRASVIGEILYNFLWYIGTALLLVLVTWRHAGAELVAPVLALFPLIMVLGVPSSTARRRVIRRISRHPVHPLELPDGVISALTRRGVTELEVRVESGSKVRNRCYRFGRRAWILLSAITLIQPQALAFTLGHEVAHLLRNDSLRRGVAMVLYIGVLVSAFISFDPAAIGVAVASVLGHYVATHWWSELSCDAIGVRLSGSEAMFAWVANRRTLLRGAANRRPRWRLRRALGTLSHPPLALRLSHATGARSQSPRSTDTPSGLAANRRDPLAKWPIYGFLRAVFPDLGCTATEIGTYVTKIAHNATRVSDTLARGCRPRRGSRRRVVEKGGGADQPEWPCVTCLH